MSGKQRSSSDCNRAQSVSEALAPSCFGATTRKVPNHTTSVSHWIIQRGDRVTQLCAGWTTSTCKGRILLNLVPFHSSLRLDNWLMYFITCHLFGVIIIASIVHLLALAFDARPGVLPFEQQDWCAGVVISSRDVATRSQITTLSCLFWRAKVKRSLCN
jgi:hypothetical protein